MTNLTLLILVPVLTAIAVMIVPGTKNIRWTAFVGSLIQLGLSVGLLFSYLGERAAGNSAQMLFTTRYSWFPAFNIEYFVGVDGISVTMLLLTAVVVLAGVLISWKMESLNREFFFMLLLLSVGAYVFFI